MARVTKYLISGTGVAIKNGDCAAIADLRILLFQQERNLTPQATAAFEKFFRDATIEAQKNIPENLVQFPQTKMPKNAKVITK